MKQLKTIYNNYYYNNNISKKPSTKYKQNTHRTKKINKRNCNKPRSKENELLKMYLMN